MNRYARTGIVLLAALLSVLCGCGGKPQPAEKPGVVYLDPNAPTASKATDAPALQPTAAPAETKPEQSAAPAVAEEAEAPAELYFESKGVRIEPMMAAAPVLEALGEPMGRFEADSCAYLGKDVFYYYPGFELTVNEVDGVLVITAVAVVDDTVTTPQGLRIYDEEEKLQSILGGTEENGLYVYQDGKTRLLVRVKEAEGEIRRIASMEYRAVEDQ